MALYSVSAIGNIIWYQWSDTGIILGMGPANKRRRYDLTSSLTGWAHTQNDPRDIA